MDLTISKEFSPNNLGALSHEDYAAELGLSTAELERLFQTGHRACVTSVAQADAGQVAAERRTARVNRKANNGMASGKEVTTKAHSSSLLAGLLRRIRH